MGSKSFCKCINFLFVLFIKYMYRQNFCHSLSRLDDESNPGYTFRLAYNKRRRVKTTIYQVKYIKEYHYAHSHL